MGSQTSKNLQIPNNIKTMINNFKMLSNPEKYVKQALQQNPQLQSLLQASNGDAEQAFRNLAKQMNVNPDEIISMLK